MTLAEKIAALRKQKNFSQEDLAAMLGVTRQAVSKWESAQSMPDLDKIVQLSQVLGVSTDYLLKEDLEESAVSAEVKTEQETCKRVTREQAETFLQLREAAAPKIALGVALCVWSPIVLIALSVMLDFGYFGISDAVATGAGLCVLLVMVAAAVALFLTASAPLRAFSFLENTAIETNDETKKMLHARREGYAPAYARQNTIGVVLCILSVLPMFASFCIPGGAKFYTGFSVCPLLAMVGVACFFLVRGGMIHGAFDQLLEEGDYTRSAKARSHVIGAISAVYWLVVTAVFLFYTFGPNGNWNPQYSWFIWAIGGVLYGALMAGLSIYRKRSK